MVQRDSSWEHMEQAKCGAGNVKFVRHLQSLSYGLGKGRFTCSQIAGQGKDISGLGDLTKVLAKSNRFIKIC